MIELNGRRERRVSGSSPAGGARTLQLLGVDIDSPPDLAAGFQVPQSGQSLTDELRAAARNSELVSRELTHCLALAGETEEALRWLENTVRTGNVNYPFWSQHNEWVDPILGNSRFGKLMRHVEQEWLSAISRLPAADSVTAA